VTQEALVHLEEDPLTAVEHVLEMVRETLGMDMAYLADTRAGLQDYRVIAGDGASFGASVGDGPALDGTYCELMLAGRLGPLVRDTRSDPATRGLAMTERAGIGSYVGVPVTLGDGVYGTLCAVSHDPADELRDRDVAFMRVIAQIVGEQIERERKQAGERRAAVRESLMLALEVRDGYTEEHCHAVVDLALRVGLHLSLAPRQLRDLENVALLHDIGKLGVPDAVLRKPGPLTAAEWDLMRAHVVIGSQIVAAMPSLADLTGAIRAGHERWDGAGYPDGLAGEAIPITSRIVFVCDAYHAMISDRPYRLALGDGEARAELRRNTGTQFCPHVVTAALAVLRGEDWSRFHADQTPTMVVSDERVYIYANRAAEAVFGVPATSIVGQPLGAFTPAAASDRVEPAVRAIAGRERHEGRHPIQTPNGERTVRYRSRANVAPGAHLLWIVPDDEPDQARFHRPGRTTERYVCVDCGFPAGRRLACPSCGGPLQLAS
jgi:response regulator RpfG family c-di-GMP phosphodiesterase